MKKGNPAMAEVKRDVIEHIFDIDKDNGQTIQLNIMKWGRNSQKYDLRIWNEDKPLKGFTLSDQELKGLVIELEKKYGKRGKAKSEIKEQFPVEEVKDVDLKTILEKYPECENDNARLRAVLRDYYPKNSREVNVVLNVQHCGIAGQIKKMKKVDQTDMNRFVAFMEKEFGVMEQYTVGAVLLWAKALNVVCNVNVADISKKKTTGMKAGSNQKKKPIVKKGTAFGYGEQVFEDSRASASYQGIYKFNGMFAQGMRIRFFFENKTKKDMRVEVKNITVNGLVLESGDLFNSCVEAGRRVVDTVLVYRHNMEAVGVKDLKEIKSISVQFEYELDGKKYRSEDCELSPYIVKE